MKSTPEIIAKVVQLAKATRDAAKNGTGIASAMSTREVIGVVEAATLFAPLAASGMKPLEMAVETVYSMGLPRESRAAVKTLLKALT
ncbi:MAG: CbbQ/NirQ/NorQ C-terminal domain-containing protein [Xanthomonadales bacterium]|nr:CbbQ/NirQ/NorQ C-terminal domain-containing protein [Xanthomonadales bacterium]